MSIESTDSLLADLTKNFNEQALPPTVSPAVGMIATYKPSKLKLAVSQAHQRYATYKQDTKPAGNSLEATISDSIGILQQELGAQIARQETPTADILDRVFDSPDNLGVIEAERRKKAIQLGKKLAADEKLAGQLDTHIRNLSQRSRMWGAVLGLSLGTLSTFGILGYASQPEATQQLTVEQAQERSDRLDYAFYGSAALTMALGAVGMKGGEHFKGHIAHYRARKRIQRARKTG